MKTPVKLRVDFIMTHLFENEACGVKTFLAFTHIHRTTCVGFCLLL